MDGGNTAVWGNFYSELRRPNTLLATFKFGMLGAGVGQVLGAKIERPEAQVVGILGDGAMGFHMQELETALREKLPVVYLVLCDKQWGMVKLTQTVALSNLRPVIGTKES
ncbi:MAG: thiamine pyrophosphate-binding protein, partial [Deltaproteobacteria bacterium]|nr:thiamine pyrophosphate-binding protein [Deltaproteobacteria bacterium]